MTEEILTQFKVEGQPAFSTENKENDNSADSSTGEETTIDQTQSREGDTNSGETNKDDQGKNRGFADDPRWIEREGDWKKRFNEQEERHVGELSALREEIDGKFKTSKDESMTPDVPEWFGGDSDQWKSFLKWNESLSTDAEERAYQRITQTQREEQSKIDEATRYFQTEAERLESDKTTNPKGVKIDRNKLLKLVLDRDLVDSKGRWNYSAGFEIYKSQSELPKSANNDARKALAGATTSENRAETKPSNVTTSKDFDNPNNRPW